MRWTWGWRCPAARASAPALRLPVSSYNAVCLFYELYGVDQGFYEIEMAFYDIEVGFYEIEKWVYEIELGL